jgi:hypothetical protein
MGISSIILLWVFNISHEEKQMPLFFLTGKETSSQAADCK